MDINAAIRSVARHVQYSPNEMSEMFFDDQDFFGLIYWYNDAVDSVKKVKEVSEKQDGGRS